MREIIQLDKKEYETLTTLANRNAEEIRSLAKKMWEEKGVPSLEMSININRDFCGKSRIDCNTWFESNNDSFAISENFEEELEILVNKMVNEAAVEKFGDLVKAKNRLEDEERKLIRYGRLLVATTILCGTIATILSIFLLMK